MNSKKMSSLQFSVLTILPILSLFGGIGLYDILKIAKMDAYISTIITTILGFIFIAMFIYIFNYKEKLSLPEKNIYLFGKVIGTIINYVLCGLMFFIALVLIYSISNFIVTQFLTRTPIIIILFFMGIVIIYAVSKGIEVIARAEIIFFIIVILLTCVSTFGVIPYFDVSNIKPIMAEGINRPLSAGIYFLFTNVIPIIVMLIYPKNNIPDKNKTSKYLIVAYLVAMLFVFLATFLTIGALGIELIELFPHPEYMVLKKISFLGFIDRIENVIYVKWLLNDFVCFSLIVYYISNSIKKRNKQKALPIIITITIMVLSQLLFKDNTQFKWFVFNIYPYLNLALFLILIIIILNIFIRKTIIKET